DHCKNSVKTGNRKWPDKIWVNCCETPIDQVTANVILDQQSLAAKIGLLRKSTVLKIRKKENLQLEGDVLSPVGWVDVKDKWEVAYGRIETIDQLRPLANRSAQNGDTGFGQPAIASVQIVGQDIPQYFDDKALVLPAMALGQNTAADPFRKIRLTGRVSDAAGLPLPRATVTLTIVGSEKPATSVLTNANGGFVFPSVSPQPHELLFQKQGFKSGTMRLTQEAIDHDIDVGPIVLKIGEVNEGPMFPASGKRAQPKAK